MDQDEIISCEKCGSTDTEKTYPLGGPSEGLVKCNSCNHNSNIIVNDSMTEDPPGSYTHTADRWQDDRRRAIPLDGKKYLIVPGPMQEKGTEERHHITAESLIHLYGVDEKECHVYVDGKDFFRHLPQKMVMLIPRYEREDYNVEKCFTIKQMIEHGYVKEEKTQ